MADILGTFYQASKVRVGTSPSSPGVIAGDPVIPVNPPGSNPVFDAGIGIKLNGQVIGGVKQYIQPSDTLVIPVYWQYNIHGVSLDIDGIIQNDGEINID